MATATIGQPIGKDRRPELINIINTEATINDVFPLSDEDGVITALDDRSLRIWLRRESGKYWPSVCQFLESTATVIFYHESSRRLFCGCDSGLIMEFLVGEDFNKINLQTRYTGHQTRILALSFSSQNELLLSTCREKRAHVYSTNSADDDRRRRIGYYSMSAPGMSIAIDDSTKRCFIGDSSGVIHFLKIEDDDKCKLLTILSGHTGPVQNLVWAPDMGCLFSGSFDKSIIVWDVNAEQGVAIELNGHSDRLVGVVYDRSRRLLLSCSADGHTVIWPTDVKRSETPEWIKNDSCQICNLPFFWNVRDMWARKKIGSRQHHCRKCGHAICDDCSTNRKTLPLLGYEIPQRVCEECMKILKPEETTPLASMYDLRQGTIRMSYSPRRKVMITACTDRVIRIWDMSTVV